MVEHPVVRREVDQPSGLFVAEQAAIEAVAERRAELPSRSFDALHRGDVELGEVFWFGCEDLQGLPDAFDGLRGAVRMARDRDPAVRVERAEADPGLGSPDVTSRISASGKSRL